MSINWSSGNTPQRPETPEDIIAEFVSSPLPSQETQEIDLTPDLDTADPQDSQIQTSQGAHIADTVSFSPEEFAEAKTSGPITSRINVDAIRSRLKSLSAPVPSVAAPAPAYAQPEVSTSNSASVEAPQASPARSRVASRSDSRSSRSSARTPNEELVPARQAHLFVTHLDPWSVAKGAFMLGVTLAGITMVATIALWLMLSAAGVFEAVTGIFNDVSGSGGGVSFLSLGRLIGLSMVVSAVEIVLISVMSTLFAVLYNLSVGFTGGIEVTLTDRSA